MENAKLIDICNKIPTDNLRGYLVPASWNPSSEGAIFPLPLSWRWSSVETLCTELTINRGAVYALPLIWQLEPLMHKTIRTFSRGSMVISPVNIDVLIPFIDEVGVDIIFTTPELIFQIYERLQKLKVPLPKALVVIHNKPDYLEPSFENLLIVHELHLVPGLPLAFQNISIAQSGNPNQFCLNNNFEWHQDEHTKSTSVVSMRNKDLPVLDTIPIPFTFTKPDGAEHYSLTNI